MEKKERLCGFTFVELIVAVIISAIVLLGVLSFVGDAIRALSNSNSFSTNIIILGQINEKLNDFNAAYENKSLLVDNADKEGADIILFTDSGSTSGMLFGLIDMRTNTFFTGSLDYKNYSKRHIGFKQLTQSELSLLLGDNSLVYNYTIFNDKIYFDVFISDFQVKLYNTGAIGDLDIEMLMKYHKSKEGMTWSEVGNEGMYNINLNF